MQAQSLLLATAQSRIRWVVLPAIAYVLFLFAVIAVNGVAFSADGWRERKFAELLIQANWLPGRFLSLAGQADGAAHSVLNYLVYDYLLALIVWLANDQWALVHGIVNALLLGGTLSISALVLVRVNSSRMALGIFWALAFLGSHLTQWAFITQSEPLYTMEVAAILMVATAAFGRDDGKRPWGLAGLLVVLALVCFFTRPTSPPVAAVCLWLAALAFFVLGGPLMTRLTRYLWTLAVLGAGLIGVLFLGAGVLADPTLLPEGSALRSAYAEFYTPRAEQGQIVWDRPETYIEKGIGFGHSLAVASRRIPAFFWFRADGYSSAHNLFNTGYFPALYLLTLLGIWAGLSPRSGLSLPARAVIWVALPLILAIPFFHAITLLDFNWRYRTPLYPALYLISAIGGAWAIQALLSRLTGAKPQSAVPH